MATTEQPEQVPGHSLREVVQFDKGGEVYWRWYCECGSIGGRAGTEEVARHGHFRHTVEMR
jgi:hypothetical protein